MLEIGCLVLWRTLLLNAGIMLRDQKIQLIVLVYYFVQFFLNYQMFHLFTGPINQACHRSTEANEVCLHVSFMPKAPIVHIDCYSYFHCLKHGFYKKNNVIERVTSPTCLT